jgi:hypothetical protein
VPFGPQTSRALDHYLSTRRSHRLAGRPALWLGDRSKKFSYDALHKTLEERAAAGIEGFRPRRLRHTAASPLAGRRWQRGRSDGGGRLDPAGHAAVLHPGAGLGAGCQRGPGAQPRRSLTAVAARYGEDDASASTCGSASQPLTHRPDAHPLAWRRCVPAPIHVPAAHVGGEQRVRAPAR